MISTVETARGMVEKILNQSGEMSLCHRTLQQTGDFLYHLINNYYVQNIETCQIGEGMHVQALRPSHTTKPNFLPFLTQRSVSLHGDRTIAQDFS